MLSKNEIGNYITHPGGWPGYGTVLTRYIAADITIIILSNNEFNSSQLSGPLAYIVTDRQAVPPCKHGAINIDTLLLNKYVGKYLIPNVPNPVKMELFKKEGTLFYRYENKTIETELKPESSTKFFNDKADMQIEIQVGSTSEPVKTFIIFSSMKKEIKKLSE